MNGFRPPSGATSQDADAAKESAQKTIGEHLQEITNQLRLLNLRFEEMAETHIDENDAGAE